jgi:hypothetical protein
VAKHVGYCNFEFLFVSQMVELSCSFFFKIIKIMDEEQIRRKLPVELQRKIVRTRVFSMAEQKKQKGCLELTNQLYKYFKPLFDERFTEHIEVQGPEDAHDRVVKVFFWPIRSQNTIMNKRIQGLLKRIFRIEFELCGGSGMGTIMPNHFVSSFKCKSGALPKNVLLGINFAKCIEYVGTICRFGIDTKNTLQPITQKAFYFLVNDVHAKILHESTHIGLCDLDCVVTSFNSQSS